MFLAWPLIVLIGIAAGVILGLKGLLVPILLEVGWWVERGIAAGFHGANGENVAAERVLAASFATIVGLTGVVIALGLRALASRIRRLSR